MKYRLYVNGKCKNTRKLTGSIGIGGVIISDDGKEISFSKTLGAEPVVKLKFMLSFME